MTTIDSSPIPLGLDADIPLGGPSRRPEEAGSPNGFAEVFAGLHAPPARATAPDLAAQPPLLQRVELSPAMRLIMPAAPAPDLASLQAFARSQGLDEQAIQHLLGDVQPATAGADAAAAQALPAEPPAAVALAALWAWPPVGGALASETAAELPPASTPVPGLLPPGLLRATQAARAAAPAPEAPAPGKTTAWAQPVEVISLDLMVPEPTDPDGLPPGAALKGLDGGQAGMLRAWLLPRDTAASLDEGRATASGLAVVSRAAGAATMMAGDLARLDPAAMAAAEPAASDDGASLGTGLPPQLLQTEATSGNEGLATAGRALSLQDAAALSARAPAEPALPGGSGRESADQLAQKMGEAIAQRLVSRLEQGNWQFRFVLNPRSMGEIQVNLHMHGGGLDGSFVASQAGTRELLNDGLQRLRDTLNASGMNVASLDVGAGHSSRQGQQSMAAAVPPPPSGPRAQAPVAPEAQAPGRRESFGGEQGWDVLV